MSPSHSILSAGESESLLLKSIRAVGQKLTNKDLLVSVDGLGHNIEKLACLSLELLGLRVGDDWLLLDVNLARLLLAIDFDLNSGLLLGLLRAEVSSLLGNETILAAILRASPEELRSATHDRLLGSQSEDVSKHVSVCL